MQKKVKSMKNLTKLLMLLVYFTTSTTFASEKIYKWVDANGQTHYTTKKPENKNSQEMNIRVAKPRPSTAPQINEEKEKVTASERFDEYRKQRENKKKRSVANKKRCNKAKATLARFKEQIHFAHTDAKGEKTYLEDSQREEILNASNKAIKKYCK